MWYGVEYAYGSTVVNNGGRADVIYQFSSRRLRDVWVADGAPQIGPGERAALTARDPLVRRTPPYLRVDGDSAAWRVLAEQRVENSPSLRKHYATIMYDWPETEHWRWIATAPEREVIEWARAIEKAEESVAGE